MYRFFTKGLIVLFLLLTVIGVSAQDTLTAPDGWKVSSNRVGEGEYELVFTLASTGGWQVYSPLQDDSTIETTEIRLKDSAITLQKFQPLGTTVPVNSTIFGTRVNVYEGSASWKATIRIAGEVPGNMSGKLVYSFGKNDEYYNGEFDFTVEFEGGSKSSSRILIPSIDINNPVADCGDTTGRHASYLTIFLLGFLGGLIALFTPCVFPMIPLTVSFFTSKGKGNKGIANALLYGFFIFLIYLLITIPFHIAGTTDPAIFNNISTNVWLNLLFFVIFVVFAISFFGVFEITLPSGLANSANSRSSLGKIGGIFFMALTLVIVSFSCTGPILGTLLAGVAGDGAWPLTTGAAGFGLALGLPFVLFALFPRWLQSIPKSGGWMTDIKVVLGFVEIALALKFLANADNVMQWGILKREVLIGLWVIVGLAIVLYLLGWIRIGHSSKPRKFGAARVFFIILFSTTTLYLVPGLTNTKWAKLGLISGFPPPLCYSIYAHPVNCDEPLLDYEVAIALAKQKNKPVLIDFTGWACVNCRRMEENVWTNSAVDRLMKEEFILVSLYVDERTKLPTSQRVIYKAKNGTEKSILTVGDKWTAFQVDNFEATSQPQYAIISPDEKALVKTKYYTPDASEFAAWLQCGLDAYRKKSQE